MTHRLIRRAATVATTLGLAAGVSVAVAESAHAVAANWQCMTLSPVGGSPRGVVDGSQCVGPAYTGTGWFQVYVGGGAYQIVYRCNYFVINSVGTFGDDVTGYGCFTP